MRLLSYNIHKGIGGNDRRYRLERVCHVIEHENPDLILLQEVTRDAPNCGQTRPTRTVCRPTMRWMPS